MKYRIVRQGGGERHGGASRKTKHPLYNIWAGMKQRCLDEDHVEYERYRARGITVCNRWQFSFKAFVEDVVREAGERPSKLHSIDRIKNWIGYRPGNVRWATPAEQNRNQRTNHFVEFRGERLCVVDWARKLGVDQSLVRYRLKHWGVERALTTPVRGR